MIHPDFQYGENQHKHYQESGFHFFDHFLTADALEECRTRTIQIVARIRPEGSPEEIINAHQCGESWIYELATQPKVLDMIECQIGPNIVLWSSHLLCKQPQTGRLVPWHQDAPYWNVKGNMPASLWIPLDDVDAENGAMSVLPGWHNKGTLARVKTGENLFSEEIDPVALPENIDKIKVSYFLKAGQCAIHHTMMPHNSPPNKSNRWRRVLVLRYMAADGEMGEKVYTNFQTGEQFNREYYLVRGIDVAGRGLERCPEGVRSVSVLTA